MLLETPDTKHDLSAFVAASSQGIGFAVAKKLVEQGCNVTINGRDLASLIRAENALRRHAATGVLINSWLGDITSKLYEDRLLKQIENLDILVTNANGPTPKSFEQITREDFKHTFDTNGAAMLSLIQHVLPAMKNKGFGRIINILSTTAIRPISGLDASAAARAALIAALRGPALTVIGHGVTINHVLPGPILTNRTKFFINHLAQEYGITYEEAYLKFSYTMPAKRIGTTDEVAGLCAFLCSRDAGFITGQSICVDGGLTI